MLYCHNCTSKISPQELYDFSSNRRGARPICPVCFALGELENDSNGGVSIHAK